MKPWGSFGQSAAHLVVTVALCTTYRARSANSHYVVLRPIMHHLFRWGKPQSEFRSWPTHPIVARRRPLWWKWLCDSGSITAHAVITIPDTSNGASGSSQTETWDLADTARRRSPCRASRRARCGPYPRPNTACGSCAGFGAPSSSWLRLSWPRSSSLARILRHRGIAEKPPLVPMPNLPQRV